MGSTARWWTIPALAIIILSSIAMIFFQVLPKTRNKFVSGAKPIVSITSQQKGSSVLAFAPQLATIKGKKFSVDVTLDTNTDKISALELHLSFDPKMTQIKDIIPGSFFTNPTVFKKEIDNKKGEAIFIIGTLSPKSGSGMVAEVQIEGLKLGEVKISIIGSKAAAVGKSDNVLIETKEGVFITQ